MRIESCCEDCGNTQSTHVWQCDCGCGNLARVGDYVKIGEAYGEIVEFKLSPSDRAMLVIEPDSIDMETTHFTHEIEEILL